MCKLNSLFNFIFTVWAWVLGSTLFFSPFVLSFINDFRSGESRHAIVNAPPPPKKKSQEVNNADHWLSVLLALSTTELHVGVGQGSTLDINRSKVGLILSVDACYEVLAWTMLWKRKGFVQVSLNFLVTLLYKLSFRVTLLYKLHYYVEIIGH